ncbi:MAG: energy-coupled thiamine transporter ThiT [Lachnospiraceae bacterium]|nr:energy-coupled thiamine transporter ThiT [Lachnospiraceae bacterium]
MSNFISFDEGYYNLTKTGLTCTVILLILILILIAFLAIKKQDTGKISTKQLTITGACLALAFITSYIKIEWAWGGSITLFSMFFICFIGYLFGAKLGFAAAFAYSILQFLQSGGAYMLSPFQVCCDYFFAFTALGIAGLWYKKKHGLVVGYIVACLVRGLFHTIGGQIYWLSYMPEDFPQTFAAFYSPIYNYSYILTEMALTLIVINLPPVKKAIERLSL